ncbi:MAG: hypothetical protein PUI79_05130 [Campylobacteraceae bacterium]|nr:hypothetical protein [Campylobacteraceae bacterium]
MRVTSDLAGHGRGAPVFSSAPAGWLLKRNCNVYTQVIKNCSKKELEPLILKHTGLGTVYSDELLMMGDYGAHYRINADGFGKNHINREFPSLC